MLYMNFTEGGSMKTTTVKKAFKSAFDRTAEIKLKDLK
jgi:hypothetical protein